jgi:tetratricopeptide (TPR) repeat protein
MKIEHLLSKARNAAEFIRHAAIAFIAAGTVLFAVMAVYQAATNDSVVIEPVAVPSEFEGRGYGGAISTQRILDEISTIQSQSASRKGTVGIADKPVGDSVPALETPVGGINFKNVANVLRQAMGRQVIRITGEITARETKAGAPKTFELRLRRLPERKIIVSVESGESPDQLFRMAAWAMVESFDPYIAARAYYRGKDVANAQRMINVCLTNNDPGDDKWAWMLKAWMDFDAKRYQEVIADAEAGLRIDPKFASAYYWQSMALREKKEFDMALKAAELSIGLSPGIPQGHFAKGRVLRDMGHHEDAIRSFDQAITRDPRHYSAYNQSGLSLMDLQRWKEAAERFERALHLEPGNVWYHHNLASALQGQGLRAEALARINFALSIDAENPALHILKGNIELSLGKISEALASATILRKLVEQDKKKIPEWAAEDAARLLELSEAKQKRQ